MTTDNEYIVKVIKNYERRKKLAALFGFLATVFAVISYLAYAELDKGAISIIEFASSSLTEGIMLTNADIHLIDRNNALVYYYGYQMGGAVNAFAISAGLALGYCLKMLFWSRKERIIKELYEKTEI